MKKILFLCTGNTCRSPMAQAIAGAWIKEHKLNLSADSAGLAAYPGSPVSENAIAVMRERGLDLSAFRSKQATEELLKTADSVYAMTPEHCLAAQAWFPGSAKKIKPLSSVPVADPYGKDMAAYRKAADDIEKAIQKILGEIQ